MIYQIHSSEPACRISSKPNSARALRSLATEEAAEGAEDSAELWGFSSHHVIDHGMIGFRDFGFHEFRDRDNRLVGHFVTKAEGHQFTFQFVHKLSVL